MLTYENDRLAGYSLRFAEAIGIGYRLFNAGALRVGLELGPAVRQTHYTDGRDENAFAARVAANLRWKIAPGADLTEAAFVYASSPDTSLKSTTALTAKLIGPLSARASFMISNESDPPSDRKRTDTMTRATLIYSF